MIIVEHTVSHRNGAQVMVAGLKLAQLGYRRGARVILRDPTGRSENPPWEFVVANDEHATLVCRDPLPPDWIVKGVRVSIEISEPLSMPIAVESITLQYEDSCREDVTIATLSEWRRDLVQILARLEGDGGQDSYRGVATRIDSLSKAGRVPRDIAALMRVVSEMRNAAEYEAKVLTKAESDAVANARLAIVNWAKENI